MANKFIFDIIVTRFEVYKTKITDPNLLVINTIFNNKQVVITSSRINVSDFRNERALAFDASPDRLRKNLIECGLQIVVKYDNGILGTARMVIPPMVTDRIAADMSDIMHVDNCLITLNGERTGQLEVLFRLIIKCEVPPKEGELSDNRNVEQGINPRDILFVIGESQRCQNRCDNCLDVLDPDEGDDRLELDLLRYRNGQELSSQFPDKFHPAGNAACCELKKMTAEYEQIIEEVTRSAALPPMQEASCRGRKQTQLKVSQVALPRFTVTQNQVYKSDGNDASDSYVKPIRFCPICLTNMSWLPKFAACPKCAVKPQLVQEMIKNPSPSADKILKEYLGKPWKPDDELCKNPCKKAEEEEDSDGCPRYCRCKDCRCHCKNGKKCAHCRIREMYKEMLKDIRNEKGECPKVVPEPNEDFCVLSDDDSTCSPFLARVFSELRELYDINDTVHSDDKCAKVNSPYSHKITLADRSKANASSSLHKGIPQMKNYNDSFKKFGHKNCINLRPAVSKRHGWAWTSSMEARKHGWKPGAIRKRTKKIMEFFLSSGSSLNASTVCEELCGDGKKKETNSPILNVTKKNGEIFITLRGIPSPDFDMKPIVFKVVKSDLAIALREIKQKLKDFGFSKCTCHKSVMLCVCRPYLEKKELEMAINEECAQRLMPSCTDHLILTDTSDTEMDFDFNVTPPAACNRLEDTLTLSKPCTASHGTQFEKKDFQKIPPKHPITMDPYWRSYDCATGDRYTGTAFGEPGENVFEDGTFGYFGGGPHGQSLCPGARKKPANIWGARLGGPMPGARYGTPSDPSGFPKGFPGGGRTGPFALPIKKGTDKPIPVRMPERYYKAQEENAKAEAEALNAKNKKGISMFLKPLSFKAPVIGPDGLTAAQRKRRKLMEQPVPPLDSIKKRGKPYNPCDTCNPCDPCCRPCCPSLQFIC